MALGVNAIAGPKHVVSVGFETIGVSDATSTRILWYNNTGQTVAFKNFWLVSTGAYTGAATNFRSVEIVNEGTDGSGSTELASWDGDKGNDLTANSPQALTNTATTANLNVASGEVLSVTFTENGTGLGLTQGTVFGSYE